MSATLYVVATPIGNLEDITFRAVRILKEVDWIACEDTRQTAKLLQHYEIGTPMISYHEHNEMERARELVSRMLSGSPGALVSDAGMPLVSDPGYRLVRAAVDAGIDVVALPGATASLTALAASGLPTDQFHFGGFLPVKPGQRFHAIEAIRHEHATVIFYEAPHRILDALADIESALGPRQVVVARELTKMHEEYLRGTAAEIRTQLAGRDAVRGEFTVLIGKATKPVADDTPINDAVESCMRGGMSRMDAMKTVARQRGLSKRDVYRSVEILPDPAR
jgi:16S rRNA (cytidine1402-2'-O)-methyltransferase